LRTTVESTGIPATIPHNYPPNYPFQLAVFTKHVRLLRVNVRSRPVEAPQISADGVTVLFLFLNALQCVRFGQNVMMLLLPLRTQ
jgi:hypothetical protein